MLNEKISDAIESMCDRRFPDDEVGWCLLAHELACFAECVEDVTIIKTTLEARETSDYEIEPPRHG